MKAANNRQLGPEAQNLPQHQIAGPRRDRRPRSKISRFPAPIREFVNQAIHDGLPYSAIASQLAQKGYPGLNNQNISNWYYSGYQTWLRQRHHTLSLCFHILAIRSTLMAS